MRRSYSAKTIFKVVIVILILFWVTFSDWGLDTAIQVTQLTYRQASLDY